MNKKILPTRSLAAMYYVSVAVLTNIFWIILSIALFKINLPLDSISTIWIILGMTMPVISIWLGIWLSSKNG